MRVPAGSKFRSLTQATGSVRPSVLACKARNGLLRIPVIPEHPIQYAVISQSDADCAVSLIKLITRLGMVFKNDAERAVERMNRAT